MRRRCLPAVPVRVEARIESLAVRPVLYRASSCNRFANGRPEMPRDGMGCGGDVSRENSRQDRTSGELRGIVGTAVLAFEDWASNQTRTLP